MRRMIVDEAGLVTCNISLGHARHFSRQSARKMRRPLLTKCANLCLPVFSEKGEVSNRGFNVKGDFLSKFGSSVSGS